MIVRSERRKLYVGPVVIQSSNNNDGFPPRPIRMLHSRRKFQPTKGTDPGVMKARVLALLLVSLPLAGQPAAEPPADDRYDFVLANIIFVMLHEFAHAVIDDFDIPVLGNEEDAADTLAAVALIRLDKASPERDFAFIRMLITAADANRILWQRGFEKQDVGAYLARHPLSVQRAARITCLVYGSDVEHFAPLPEIVGLPEFRTDWCEDEFQAAEAAWNWVGDSYVRKAEGGEDEHEFAYGVAREPAHEGILEKMQKARVLERSLELIKDNVLLPEAITLRTRSCGSLDAYWEAEDREIVLCYELVDGFYKLSADQKVTALEARIRAISKGSSD